MSDKMDPNNKKLVIHPGVSTPKQIALLLAGISDNCENLQASELATLFLWQGSVHDL